MPGANCCIPGCFVHQKKDGPSLFKVIKATDEWSKSWRERVLGIVLRYRELDKSFKSQLEANSVHICENHYEESCLIRRKFCLIC